MISALRSQAARGLSLFVTVSIIPVDVSEADFKPRFAQLCASPGDIHCLISDACHNRCA